METNDDKQPKIKDFLELSHIERNIEKYIWRNKNNNKKDSTFDSLFNEDRNELSVTRNDKKKTYYKGHYKSKKDDYCCYNCYYYR